MLNTTHYGYEVMGTGIYGRKRKPDFFRFDLAMVPVDGPQPDSEALDKLLADVVKREAIKPGTSFKVIRRAWEIQPDSRTTEPLRYDTLKTGAIE